VLKEAAVFDGGDGVDHDFGDVVVLDELTFAALLGVEERSEKLRFEFVGGEFSGRAAVDGGDEAGGNGDGGWFGSCDSPSFSV
jgi:hypothetical protein